jgi:hypothetical protein
MSYIERMKNISFDTFDEPSFCGIHYAIGYNLDLIGFIDSNSENDIIDRKSTSGYTLCFGSRPICWSRNKKSTISIS